MPEANNQDYRYEHGHRYHAHNEGAYFMPNDDNEASRLDTQHNIWLQTLSGKGLQIAPIASDIPNVLDIGTGTGVWAVAFALRHPRTQVLGIDLSAIRPIAVPPNCSFAVADAEQPWDDVLGAKKWDFIHSRMLCLGMHDWEGYFRNCFNHLQKGGYVEVQEVQVTFYSDASPTPSDNAPFLRLGHLITDSVRKAGIDGIASEKFKRMLESAGFMEVEEVFTRWPVGDWSESEQEKLIGRMEQKNLETGLHGMSMAALTKHGGFTAEEAEKLVDEAKKDIAEDQANKRYYIVIIAQYDPLWTEAYLKNQRGTLAARDLVSYLEALKFDSRS